MLRVTRDEPRQRKTEAVVHGQLMPPAAAAEYLGGFVVGTLAKWRHFGGGPEYVRISSRIFNEKSALDAYIASRRRSSTSEAAYAPPEKQSHLGRRQALQADLIERDFGCLDQAAVARARRVRVRAGDPLAALTEQSERLS